MPGFWTSFICGSTNDVVKTEGKNPDVESGNPSFDGRGGSSATAYTPGFGPVPSSSITRTVPTMSLEDVEFERLFRNAEGATHQARLHEKLIALDKKVKNIQ